MKKAIQGNTIVFSFDGLDAVTFDATKTSDAVRNYAAMHGFSARIGDNAAIARKAADGSIITVTEAMRREAVVELVDHYQSGTADWNLKASRAPTKNPVWEAIAAKKGMTYEAYVAERVAADLAELEGM